MKTEKNLTKIEKQLKKALLKKNPNCVRGVWNFWLMKTEPTLNHGIKVGEEWYTYEYQSGVGHDFSIPI